MDLKRPEFLFKMLTSRTLPNKHTTKLKLLTAKAAYVLALALTSTG